MLEAQPAQRPELPQRLSEWTCLALDCPLAGAHHTLEQFEKTGVPPHDFEPAERSWHPMTASWWATIWDSPMAAEWVDADVPDLLVLAAQVEQFWTTGDVRVAAEIRLRQREFGLTPLARRMLQWEITKVEAAQPRQQPATPAPASDPRAVLKAVS